MDPKYLFITLIIASVFTGIALFFLCRHCTGLATCIIHCIRCYCHLERRVTTSHLDYHTSPVHYNRSSDSVSLNIDQEVSLSPDLESETSSSVFNKPKPIKKQGLPPSRKR